MTKGTHYTCAARNKPQKATKAFKRCSKPEDVFLERKLNQALTERRVSKRSTNIR